MYGAVLGQFVIARWVNIGNANHLLLLVFINLSPVGKEYKTI
jgi:hypothetical protein